MLEKFLPHETRQTLMFLSLVITPENIEGSAWHADREGKTVIAAVARGKAASDSWEDRIVAADKVISRLEELVPGAVLSKVVLGLPSDYLTESGDIESDVRPEIKKLTTELELSPIGFVSVHQALIHKIKIDEGIPPSVILLNVNSDGLTVYLYKIGNLIGSKSIGRGDPVTDFEAVLKGFKEMEVLPSRILLYGGDPADMEEIKRLLLKYPWPTRANFLHFPKIEILPVDATVEAISLAGSSEMKTAMGFEDVPATVPVQEEKVVAQPQTVHEEIVSPESEDDFADEVKAEENVPEPEESNVQMVEPEVLGFRKNEDILEENEQPEEADEDLDGGEETEEERPALTGKKIALPFKIPSFDFSSLGGNLKAFSFRGMPVVLVVPVIIIVLIIWGVYWFLPHATVTVLEMTKLVDETATVTIDPAATLADPKTKIIPGKKEEQSESGEKAVAATGKKQVGDPAKGTVTVYNKDVSGSKTFPKGSVLTAGPLKFTLDNDVTVASASSSGGFDSTTTTFSKATANITAAQIGTPSNLPAGTEFDFADFSTGIAIARNEKPLAGGTSKNITVVSRSDYDSLVKSLTDELIQKAQNDLESSVSGHQKLIAETVKTSVDDKTFTEEIDQEASQLHGKLTVSVTGLSYNEEDISTLMKGLTGSKLPTGYNFVSAQTQVKISKVQVKKDGSVTALVRFSAPASPTFDLPNIQKAIAGKSLKSAQDYLSGVAGVAGAEFGFTWDLFGKRLPANPKNISISVAMQ